MWPTMRASARPCAVSVRLSGRDHHAVAQALRVEQGPAHGLHAAQAAANDRSPAVDTQVIRQPGLTVHPVPYPQGGEIRPPGLPRLRVEGDRSGGAVAAAEIVQADDKEVIGINGFARTDAFIPPARLAIPGAVVARGVMMPGQCVTDEHGV